MTTQPTIRPVEATWDRKRACYVVTMPDGRQLVALDEQDAQRRASAYVGTYQPVRFVGKP